MIIIIMVLLAGAYETRKKRGQVFCWFEGEDGTNEHKWVKEEDGYVIFRRKKYKIMTERMSTVWVKTGIHMIFPTRAPSLSFVWYSEYPRDPRNYMRTVINPSVRYVINLTEMVKSYFQTSSPTAATAKQKSLDKWLPYIALLLIVILGWYVFQNQQQISGWMSQIQNQINNLSPK